MSLEMQTIQLGDGKTSVDRMIAVLSEENAALSAMDFARAGELLSSKCSTADALTVAWRTSKLVDVPHRAKRALAQLVDENRRLTKAAMKAQMRALDQVSRAIETTHLSRSSQGPGEYVVQTLSAAPD